MPLPIALRVLPHQVVDPGDRLSIERVAISPSTQGMRTA